MYLERVQRYYRGTEQATKRGLFLVLVVAYVPSAIEPSIRGAIKVRLPLRAFIRKVALHQNGHFMAGRANLRGKGKWEYIEGAYGSNGLPREVDLETYMRGIEVPPELEAEFWQGGGHNCAGEEADAMRAWALSVHSGIIKK